MIAPRRPARGERVVETLSIAGAGALQTLAYVRPALLWLLPILAVAVLVWRLNAAQTQRRAAWLGWWFGIAWLCAAVWWLFISMHRYGGLPAWMAALAVFALAAALSIYLALACWLYARWRRRRFTNDVALFTALWVVAEWARGVILTGFPWAASGYSQLDAPLSALAPWLGVYGIGAAIALLGALLAWVGRRPTAVIGTFVAVIGTASLVGGGSFTQPGATLTVELLQTNVPQEEKFAAKTMPEMLQWVQRALIGGKSDLVVAPETAVPLLPEQLNEVAPKYWERLHQHFASGERAALIGVPLGDYERGYTNSVAGLSARAGGRPVPGGGYRYNKMHLVPFGELVPTGFRWFTEMMNIPLGDFTRGSPNPPSFEVKLERVAPNICYEDLFGEELARRFVDPERAPTIFANVSNIGWFGDTIAITQHLNISRMRTLEFQRPMLRATNTGATAIIDHRARVTALLPSYKRAVLAGSVEGRTGITPYAAWAGRLGLWPLLAAALVTAFIATRRVRRVT